jgi:hypothetical protein
MILEIKAILYLPKWALKVIMVYPITIAPTKMIIDLCIPSSFSFMIYPTVKHRNMTGIESKAYRPLYLTLSIL